MRRWVLATMMVAGCVGTAAAGERVQSGSMTIELPAGLQAGAAYIPDENPMSPAKVALGRLLYFDKRLSSDDTVSCATCHDPAHGWAEPRKTSTGIQGKVGGRNAPTVINRLFSKEQFWGGRGQVLEDQAKGPIVNPIEMGMGSHDLCSNKIGAIAGYKLL